MRSGSSGRFAAALRGLRGASGPVLGALSVLLVLASLVFLSLRVLPGDPSTLVLGEGAREAERAALRARLGLDRPLAVQYAHFVGGLVTLDLGESLSRPGVPAFAEVRRALGPTSELAGVAVLLGAVIGVSLSLLSVG